MAEFRLDLAGRVKNFDLPKNQPLIPLYEAVVNSIYAIQERKQKENFDGKIDIRVIREPQQIFQNSQIDYTINDIIGFEISDNGIGLDDNNMKSFLQSDSTYRADIGGKGVGRFSWLKAFHKTVVESIYKEQDEWVKRKFEFSLDNLEIDDDLSEIDIQIDNKTTISLLDYFPEYQRHVKKDAEIIALSLMQHCLIYLMVPHCPKICVIDEERYCINDMFEEKIERDTDERVINVENEEFTLVHTKIQDKTIAGSKIFLFANDRMVKSIDLEKKLVDLDKNLYEEQGFYYVGLLKGKYLDSNVDMNRTAFDIAESGFEDEITIEKIANVIKNEVEIYLSNYLEEIRKKKDGRIKAYITKQAPQYNHLLKYMPEKIAAIKPMVTDSKLDEELYKLRRKFDMELRSANKKLIENIELGASGLVGYEEAVNKQFEKISEANKAALADYVSHRKVVLELLKKGLYMDENGRFNKEAYIHNLIYPMRSTSEEIQYEAHNLWLIDERLAYCEYISSDIPFNNSNKEERTDIMILDQPVALSDNATSGREYETIVIFELKKPMRNDYNASENPIRQLLRYSDKLSTNKMKDKNGRLIKVGATTQFYLYAVCDITSKLKEIADEFDLIETPDGMGLYKYHEKKRAYIEIISYDKLIVDADKRNRVLFEKLGI